MERYVHSGDIGDLIYGLPVIRALGGGDLVLISTPGKTAHAMTREKVDRLRPLLELQPYINSVSFCEDCPPTQIDGFRDHWKHGNLSDMHLATHGIDWRARVEPWIEVEPKQVAKVVMHRSTRYGGHFPWPECVAVYKKDAVFVGYPEEHAVFCEQFGEVPYYRANNFLELAQVIAGSQWYCGNQSSPLAVAHAMKHSVMMEICPGHCQQHCVFQRANNIIVWDGKVEWPKLS